MKIAQETDSLMIIKERNILSFIIASILVLVGILTLIFKKENFPVWASIIFILIGFLVIMTSKIMTITFNKGSNNLSIATKSLFKQKKESCPLSDVKQIELQQVYSTSYNSQKRSSIPQVSYKVAAILSDGSNIQIGLKGASVSVGGVPIITERGVGSRIANFLKVPFVERRPPTLGESLNAIKDKVGEYLEKEGSKK